MHNRLVHSIAEACEAADTGRTALYEAINSGELRAVKRGRRTLILDEDLRHWVQTLPPIPVKQSNVEPDLKVGGSGAVAKTEGPRTAARNI
jgi:excisionase family DNA binding protein